VSGAPSFMIVGSYFPGWMFCALIGIVSTIAVRVSFVASGLANVLPFQLLVCSAIGLCDPAGCRTTRRDRAHGPRRGGSGAVTDQPPVACLCAPGRAKKVIWSRVVRRTPLHLADFLLYFMGLMVGAAGLEPATR
jgi:hypothetical protein